MAENTSIIIKGARVNNLKNIDVEIPRNKLVVITGLRGLLDRACRGAQREAADVRHRGFPSPGSAF